MAFTRWPRVPAVRHRSGGHHHLVQRIGSEAEHAGALRFPDTAVPDLGDPVGRGGGAEHDGDVRRQPGARLQRRESSGPGRNRRQHTQALRHVMTRGNTLLLLLSAGLLSTASAQTVDSSYFNLLEWRLAGPTRGGRVLAVAGDPNDRMTFYQGTAGGGGGGGGGGAGGGKKPGTLSRTVSSPPAPLGRWTSHPLARGSCTSAWA